jgi:hypothetical protein
VSLSLNDIACREHQKLVAARKPAMTKARKALAGELVTALLAAIFGAEVLA